MPRFKYLAYLAVVCAVLLNLLSGKPDASAVLRAGLDGASLVLALLGLAGLALRAHRIPRQ